MKRASVTEVKNRLSALLDQVKAGETILIVERGIPVARIEPAAAYGDDHDGRIARLVRKGILRPARKRLNIDLLLSPPPRAERGADIVQAVLDERREGR
jgi:prevent-host-death family protein